MTIEWLGEHSEAAAKLSSGEASIAMLPEPFATTTLAQNSDLEKSVDLSKAWEDAAGGVKLEMGCVVVNKEWAEKNPAVVKAFMKAYKKSVETINKADETAGNYVVSAGIMQKSELAQKAIPNCAITFIKPSEAKADLKSYYDVLYQANPKSVGGAVPDDAFYELSY